MVKPLGQYSVMGHVVLHCTIRTELNLRQNIGRLLDRNTEEEKNRREDYLHYFSKAGQTLLVYTLFGKSVLN